MYVHVNIADFNVSPAILDPCTWSFVWMCGAGAGTETWSFVWMCGAGGGTETWSFVWMCGAGAGTETWSFVWMCGAGAGTETWSLCGCVEREGELKHGLLCG